MDQIKRKKLLVTTKEENDSNGETLSRFENKKFDLPMIMNWEVTIKSYTICDENEIAHSHRKFDIHNKLHLMSPLKPTNIPPAEIKACVVNAMRVLRLIPITTTQAQRF